MSIQNFHIQRKYGARNFPLCYKKTHFHKKKTNNYKRNTKILFIF